jgi:hypothetical protein
MALFRNSHAYENLADWEHVETCGCDRGCFGKDRGSMADSLLKYRTDSFPRTANQGVTVGLRIVYVRNGQ